MEAAVVSDRSKRLSSLLFRSISDNAKLDFALSKKLLSQFTPDDVIVGTVNNDIPILHHLLNLYRMSTSARDKADMLDIFHAALKVGADASTPYKEDPPLLFKAILLKELNLCNEIVSSGASVTASLLFGKVQWSSMFVTHLYSIPSESVPLAKLLLHADTIVRDKGQSAMGGVEGVKKLLAGASLGKPAVKSADLALHSATYRGILSTLGADNGEKIRLMDIIRSLDDLAGAVHQSLVTALLSDPAAALRFVQVIAGTAEGDGGAAYPMGRNALHFLCLSGGAVMLEQLGQLLSGLHSGAASASARAVASVDAEGTAATASASTFDAAAFECDALIRQALRLADRRDHTPISYAIMRFSASSPVGSALRRLCAQLGMDLEQEIAHSRERSTLREPNAGNTTTLSGPAAVAVDGGWRTSRIAPSLTAADAPAGGDPRVLEVAAASLPSNREFFSQYLNTGTPVIFRRSTAASDAAGSDDVFGDSVRVTQEVFRKERFLSEYGDIPVPAAAIPYAGTFGKKQVMSTIRSVADSQDPARPSSSSSFSFSSFSAPAPAEVPLYTFCTPSPQWAPQLLADVPVPSSIRRTPHSDQHRAQQGGEDSEDSGVGAVDPATQSWSFEIQFYLGPAGTGAPAHFHGHAMNTLAYGTKDWLLYPPVDAFYSTTPAQELFASLSTAPAAQQQPVRVTQRAGDVLYVPALWGHATLNTAQSIGVAHEFSVESFCME